MANGFQTGIVTTLLLICEYTELDDILHYNLLSEKTSTTHLWDWASTGCAGLGAENGQLYMHIYSCGRTVKFAKVASRHKIIFIAFRHVSNYFEHSKQQTPSWNDMYAIYVTHVTYVTPASEIYDICGDIYG